MVDIIDISKTVHEIEEIIDVGDDIFPCQRAMIIGQIAVVADDLIYRSVRLFDKGANHAFT